MGEVTDFVLELRASKAKIKGIFDGLYRYHGNSLRQDNEQILLSNNLSFNSILSFILLFIHIIIE